MEQIGTPLQVDDSTRNRDKMLFPRVMVEVKLDQEFPEKIYFIDEFDKTVEVEITYEWLPKLCAQCNGIGHVKEECRNKPTKQQWVPKKIQPTKEKILDEEGFEVVTKGKKIVQAGVVGIKVQNDFAILDEQQKPEDKKIAMNGSVGKRSNKRGDAGPSSSNG